MFKFQKDLIKPDYNREPCYVGGATHQEVFSWTCDNCGTERVLNLSEVWEGYGWKQDWSADEAEAATEHFELNMVGKSHDGGWPYLTIVSCASCKREFILYAGVNEVRNSWYKVHIQGLVSISGE